MLARLSVIALVVLAGCRTEQPKESRAAQLEAEEMAQWALMVDMCRWQRGIAIGANDECVREMLKRYPQHGIPKARSRFRGY